MTVELNPPSLRIIEIFQSIQGETSLSGLPTTFVRLAACNLRCRWCDTVYSFGRGEPKPFEEILAQIAEFGWPYVCITGGEPLLQAPVLDLMRILCDEHYQVSLETSGSLSTKEVDPRVKVILDIKCPGSGMEHKNLFQNLDYLKGIDEVKFVVADRTDYEYAKNIATQYGLFSRETPILISPVYSELSPKTLVEWLLNDRVPVRLNLQIHKIVWDPSTRGV